MKKLFTFIVILIFTTLISFAQKRVDLYRSGTFFKSYSTIDSAIKAANSFGDSLVLSAHTFYESNLDGSAKIIQYQGTIIAGDTTTIDGGGKLEHILKMGRSGYIKDIIFQNTQLCPINLRNGLTTDTIKLGGNTVIRNNHSPNVDFVLLNGTTNLMLCDNLLIKNNSMTRIAIVGTLIIKHNVEISNNFVKKHSAGTAGAGIVNAPLGGLIIKDRVKIINNTTDSNQNAAICIINQGAGFSVFIGDSVLIKNNRVLTPGFGKGGAISFFPNPTPVTTGLKSFKMGAAIFDGNEADQGGAIYCEDSTIKLELNGTIFRGNKAKKGGAIYTRGSLDIKNANFTDNTADTANSIYINSAMGGSSAPNINVESTRFYNATKPANKQNHIYATYRPLASIPPAISFIGNWWGKSDTIGVLQENPKGLSALNYWAVANWAVKNGTPVVKADTTFPVAATIKYNHGLAFPASSFAMLKGTFTVDTGTFTPVTANINSSNVVSSTYKTFKDTSSKSANADIVAWIDADTFKTSVLVWSIDTLVSKDTTTSIAKKSLPKILIYPNPATDYINIEGAESGSSIEIYDVMGKLVRINSAEPNKQIVDIKSLPAGIYTLKIITKEGNVGTAKMLKE